MKKLFMSLALSAMTALSVSAAPSFENFVTDPDQGVVTEISDITVIFPGCEKIEINVSDAIYLIGSDWEEVPGSLMNADNVLMFVPESTITDAGEYILCIGEGALKGTDAENNTADNSTDIFVSYTIEGGSQGGGGEVNYLGYTSDPAEGEVESLSTIKVTFPNIYDLDFNSKGSINVTRNGVAIDGINVKGGSELIVTLPASTTDPGTYALNIPAGSCCGFDKSYSNWLDNPEDISLTWAIKNSADAVDFTYSVSPANGFVTASLAETVVSFDALTSVSATENAAVITLDDRTLEAVNYSISGGEKENQIKVTFSPAITAEGSDIAVQILFPAASLTGVQGEATGTNTSEIEVGYTVVPTVVYDLSLALSSPTKPNANGEISAEKQLTSFFFMADAAGLVPDETTEPNVTIKEVNGDFEASAILKKAFGLDGTKSYFSAEFLREPSYNGEYVITINQGAFGNELWESDHNLGQSNAAQTLSFTLVDGNDRLKYTLEPVEITPAEGTYGKGSDFAAITFKFDTPDVSLSDATVIYATLAGKDVDFRSEGTFVSNGDGTFTVTFTASTADGTYLFSVLAGAFSAPGGLLSPAISREYKLEGKSAITEIEADDAAKTVYNLQGMPVNGTLRPGNIYIINGKKVLVK